MSVMDNCVNIKQMLGIKKCVILFCYYEKIDNIFMAMLINF